MKHWHSDGTKLPEEGFPERCVFGYPFLPHLLFLRAGCVNSVSRRTFSSFVLHLQAAQKLQNRSVTALWGRISLFELCELEIRPHVFRRTASAPEFLAAETEDKNENAPGMANAKIVRKSCNL
mgnify:FL=1